MKDIEKSIFLRHVLFLLQKIFKELILFFKQYFYIYGNDYFVTQS